MTVMLAGMGSGTVTSNPSGISCGSTCSAIFDFGTSVTLTAAPASSSTFAGWSGEGCRGTDTCTVSLTQARSVTATFTLIPQPLTVTLAGTGSGTVTSNPAGLSCPSACSAAFDFSTSVTLTATAAGGSTFAGWSGEGCSGPDPCTVSLTQARSVTATFTHTPTGGRGGGCTLRTGTPVDGLDLTLVSFLGLMAVRLSLDRLRRRRKHQVSPPRETRRLAGAPGLQGPAGRHRYGQRMSLTRA
jgi:hypothetical protein